MFRRESRVLEGKKDSRRGAVAQRKTKAIKTAITRPRALAKGLYRWVSSALKKLRAER